MIVNYVATVVLLAAEGGEGFSFRVVVEESADDAVIVCIVYSCW